VSGYCNPPFRHRYNDSIRRLLDRKHRADRTNRCVIRLYQEGTLRIFRDMKERAPALKRNVARARLKVHPHARFRIHLHHAAVGKGYLAPLTTLRLDDLPSKSDEEPDTGDCDDQERGYHRPK
jgi:hypothetical protein